MTEFSTLLLQGNAWLFVPSAILLGALHGLEPGHSKTMMAAFIVAIRGTVTQAVLLGLSATLSHTAVVWAVAMAGLYFGQNLNAETAEPYFQLASAIVVMGVAIWMIWRIRRQQSACFHDHGHDHGHGDHDHGHAHSHDHADEAKRIDTGHGVVRLAIFEEGVPPRFRLSREGHHGHDWKADQVRISLERPDGQQQSFTFVQRDGFLESEQVIDEPHEFVARLSLGHGHHSHDYDVEFTEHHHHVVPDYEGLDVAAPGYQDPHELAHANDIRRRFTNRAVTTPQIVMFGLTGGLVPCPASITVLLLCLQLKRVALGATLVMCFSIGLALTMVASGVLAALSVKHVSKQWGGFGDFSRKAPYFSGVLMLLVGLYMGYQGWHGLTMPHAG
ncbi:MAG: nickel/cobalt efflux transporter RcnA [Burkholderiales bacterium]|nr:nickel/cobalt efflux transporter RcnA [Burkholderiales bacterium]